jgi:hypothetical protein
MNFKPIVRASKEKRSDMAHVARQIASESGHKFTGLTANPYSAEFQAEDGSFYDGWAIENEDGEIDFAFGSGQMVFHGDYVITEEDYYDKIGAGV